MTAAGWLPADTGELFGAEATAEESYDLLTVDVPPAAWISALETARDRLGCTYFDWLSAVDEPGTGFRVAAHVAALAPVRRLLLRTTVPHESPVLPTAVEVYAGAAWHERETHEMFGVVFEDHPGLDHLLLPEGFEGHPLRKDFVLAARVAKAWPGAKEPGESDHGGPRRRQMLPPGVPDPNEWGPQKGQLPPAPARPARGAARATGDRPARAAAGERPARRMRTAAQGSVGQTTPATGAPVTGAPVTGTPAAGTPGAESSPPPSAPRRARSASGGSASQRPGPAAPEDAAGAPDAESRDTTGPRTPTARRARSASEGSASQRPAPTTARPDTAGPSDTVGQSEAAAPSEAAGETPAAPKSASVPPRSSDAPWHHARPAFDEPTEPSGKPEDRGSAEAAEERSGSPETPEDPGTPEDPETSEDPETGEASRPPARSETPDDRPGGPQ
ncbi:NADH-quinone oxidoreductase subunit C [Streptomyces sp. NPDC059701]|uniref:NADH-quinone oxidoreductase subunit C n=1 Tax=Streptomyces sp. NPDC059701 TaxID=3346914 RepID=UPI0036788DA6